MKLHLALLVGSAVAASIALVVACSAEAGPLVPDDDDDGGASGGEGGPVGSSSGEAGGGDGSPSGSDGATDGSSSGEPKCDPAKDDCAKDEICSDLARTAPVCRRECKNDGECAGLPSTSCVFTKEGPPPSGGCIPTCTPFGADCPAGMSCTTHAAEATGANGIAQTSKSAFCRKVGALPLGAPCESDPAGCVANAECIFFPPGGFADSTCVTVCDASHACAAGSSCLTRPGEAFGYCKPS